jgi:hypothetical protein
MGQNLIANRGLFQIVFNMNAGLCKVLVEAFLRGERQEG